MFALAHGRQGSLWRALVDASDAENAAPVVCAARRRLDWLRREADYLPPYDYCARFLSEQGAHAALSARLGVEINDPIGELLNLALAYESQQVPSLQGFLQWLAQGEQSLKRDMDVQTQRAGDDGARGQGLEAPIVFLPILAPIRLGIARKVPGSILPLTAMCFGAPMPICAMNMAKNCKTVLMPITSKNHAACSMSP